MQYGLNSPDLFLLKFKDNLMFVFPPPIFDKVETGQMCFKERFLAKVPTQNVLPCMPMSPLNPCCFCLHRPDLKRFKVKTSKIFEQLANIENIEDVASPSVPKSPLKFTVKLTDCKFDNCCCRRSDYPLKFLLRLKDFEGVVGAGVLKGEWRINVKRFNQIPPISSLCH